jgi:hypothetical protein
MLRVVTSTSVFNSCLKGDVPLLSLPVNLNANCYNGGGLGWLVVSPLAHRSVIKQNQATVFESTSLYFFTLSCLATAFSISPH